MYPKQPANSKHHKQFTINVQLQYKKAQSCLDAQISHLQAHMNEWENYGQIATCQLNTTTQQ